MVGQTAVEILDFGNLCGGHGGSVCMWIYGRRNGSAYFRIGMNISLSLSSTKRKFYQKEKVAHLRHQFRVKVGIEKIIACP